MKHFQEFLILRQNPNFKIQKIYREIKINEKSWKNKFINNT